MIRAMESRRGQERRREKRRAEMTGEKQRREIYHKHKHNNDTTTLKHHYNPKAHLCFLRVFALAIGGGCGCPVGEGLGGLRGGGGGHGQHMSQARHLRLTHTPLEHPREDTLHYSYTYERESTVIHMRF